MSKQVSHYPYTKVEIIEERRKDSVNDVTVAPAAILVNGSEILVSEGSVHVDPGDNKNPATVSFELFVDDVHIRRVPHGYINRARHLYTQEKNRHRVVEVGLLGKIRQAFKRKDTK